MKSEGSLRENSLLFGEARLLILFRAYNWLEKTHLRFRGQSAYSEPLDLNVNLIQKHLSHCRLKLTITSVLETYVTVVS